ncbi:MAG: class I SAM-dependent methyltransferase [Ktedonobacterales bacterium]
METPRWYIDELSHAGSEHLDMSYVPGYDHKAGTDPAEDLAVLRELGLSETHTLVDLGAGTGTFALAAAPLCRRVVAVDVSPVMLALLRQKAVQSGIGNIECVQRGFLSYEHQGELADFVYSRHALHHLPDFWKAIAIEHTAAILKPGGVFYLRDLIFAFEPHEAEHVIESWLANAPEQTDYGWSRSELETHLREEHSTFNWLLEPMLQRAGFEIWRVQHGTSRVHSAYTCIKL